MARPTRLGDDGWGATVGGLIDPPRFTRRGPQRDPMTWDALFEAAADHGVTLEEIAAELRTRRNG